MDTTEISSLLERGAALAHDLACDDDPESTQDSDTVHQLTEAVRELTRWQWVRRGTGLTLCWGGRPVGAEPRREARSSRARAAAEIHQA